MPSPPNTPSTPPNTPYRRYLSSIESKLQRLFIKAQQLRVAHERKGSVGTDKKATTELEKAPAEPESVAKRHELTPEEALTHSMRILHAWTETRALQSGAPTSLLMSHC